MKYSFSNLKFFKLARLSIKAFRRYKFQIIGITILGFFAGLFEGIGVNALIPLLSFAIGQNDQANDFISRMLQSFFSFLHVDFSVKFILIFIVLLFALKACVTILFEYINIRITSDYEARTRKSLFEKMLGSTWPHLVKHKLGFLETIFMVDVPASSDLLRAISASITTITGLFIYVLIAINISSVITLSTIILGGVMFLVFYPLVKKMRSTARDLIQVNKETTHIVSENMLGLKSIKSLMASNIIAKKGALYFDKIKSLTVRMRLLKSISNSVILPVGVIYITIIFAFSFKSSDFGFAALAAIVYLIHRIFSYIQQLQGSFLNFNGYLPHLESVLNYENKVLANQEIETGKKKFSFDESLSFEDVHFAYNEKRKVLKGVNLNIKKGEFVGLIGPSGVGKTTLVDLILRLFVPNKGVIKIDGIEIRDISLSLWRQKIGYVSQDIFLINDTIRNNIAFYDNKVKLADIKEAAKKAHILDFIESLPLGFNTHIGDRGLLLSVGQRQRLVIARILAKKPEILILDEATSALDNESEAQIQSVIRELKGDITVIAIAHRLSTIMDSDRLLIIEKGRISEEGDPRKLIENKNSYFFKVYNIRE